MVQLFDEPRLSSEAVQLLNRFQKSFRSRIYNLVEDHSFAENKLRIDGEDMYRCILEALNEYQERLAGDRQNELF